MVDLTPPSSSANTPKREMDVDERRYSSGSDGPGGGPGSDTELDEAEPIETGQATPPLVEGDTAPSAGTGTGAAASDSQPQAKSKKSRRAKDSLYESDIVQRWDREIGDIFVHPAASSQPSSQPSSQSQSQAQTETETQAPSPAQGQ